jgi:hypothetical protein
MVGVDEVDACYQDIDERFILAHDWNWAINVFQFLWAAGFSYLDGFHATDSKVLSGMCTLQHP